MRSLLLLPFLLGFSVPAIAFEDACLGVDYPNNWFGYRKADKCNLMLYVLFKKEDSETLWGAWECDGNTGNTEWNVKNVDCDTANAKYVKKSGDNEPTWCEINGHE